MRVKITLACQQCNSRNYFLTKNKKLHPERIGFRKYCPKCNSHTEHKETR